MKLFLYSLLFLGTVVIAILWVVKRWTLKGGSVSPLTFLVGYNAVATILFSVIYLSWWGYALPPQLLPGFWSAVLVTAGANVGVQLLHARASSLPAGEVSFTAPLAALTPGLITLAALSLGEFPGKMGIAGIAFMASGSYVLLWEGPKDRRAKWFEYLQPFRILGKVSRWSSLSDEDRDKATVVTLSLGAACCGTVGLLFDGLYTRRGINTQGLTLGSLLVTLVLCAVYTVWFLCRPDTKGGPRFSRKLLLGSMGVGALWVAHIYTIYPSYRVDYVAYVGALKRFSILVSAVLGWRLFKEHDIKQRLLAAGLVTLGAVLLALDDLPARISTRIEGLGL